MRDIRGFGRWLSVGTAMLLAVLVPATALAISTAWTRQFGSPAEDSAGGITADSGGVTVVGTTWGTVAGTQHGLSDAFVRRYDRGGRVLWTRQIGTSNQDRGRDVASDAGGVTVLGETDGSFSGSGGTLGVNDLFVRRYDRSGHKLWTRQFGTAANEEAGAIAANGSGLVVAGTTWGALVGTNTPEDQDPIVRRYDFAGHVLWTRQFGTGEGDGANAVAIDGAGITVGGWTDGNLARSNAGPFGDAFIRRYDLSGKVLWTRQWGQEGSDAVLSLAADKTGVTAVGFSHADPYGEESSQAFIRRYDRAGRLAWSHIFGTADSEIAWGVTKDADGLTVTGYTYGSLDGTNKGTFDVFVRRYSRTGSLVWRKQFGTTGADLGIDVAADGKGFSVLGHTNGSLASANEGELDLFVRRFSR